MSTDYNHNDSVKKLTNFIKSGNNLTDLQKEESIKINKKEPQPCPNCQGCGCTTCGGGGYL